MGTAMICLVWFLSAMISMAPLIYTPWNFPFEQPKNHEISFTPNERITLENRSVILSENKCQVSHSFTTISSIYLLL